MNRSRKEIIHMKTANQTNDSRCTVPSAEEREILICRIRAAFAGLTQEQKIEFLAKLDALACEDLTKEEAAD